MGIREELSVIYLLCALYTITHTSATDRKDETQSIEELVKSRGYPIETHTVTSDGYVLVLHRIKHGRKYEDTTMKRPPVLIQHGMGDSSPVFLSRSSDMAYYLADAGYDVWVSNFRGNYYSRSHNTMNPKEDPTYWQFSFHEMGVLDLPAVLDHIKDETRGSKIHYVGVSMGCTMFLVMGTMLPDYLNYVDCVILIAPVARPQNLELISTSSKRRALRTVFKILTKMGKHENYWMGDYFLPVQRFFCGSNCHFCFLCDLMSKIGLAREKDFNKFKNKIDAYRFSSTGMNFWTVEHFMQMAETAGANVFNNKLCDGVSHCLGKFQQFDNGNGPPEEYDLSKITKRIYIFAGGEDTMAAAQDIQWLSDHLTDCLVIKEVFKEFDHEYFTFGDDLDKTLYKTIKTVIEKRPQTEADSLL